MLLCTTSQKRRKGGTVVLEDISYVIILNYNNWKYTINCIRSLLNMSYKKFRIMVLDNASTDGSVEYLCAWMNGENVETVQVNKQLQKYIVNTQQAIPSLVIESFETQKLDTQNLKEKRVVVIKNSENTGFAAGNNIAIRCAMQQRDCAYVWILNNDTIVDTAALENAVEYAKRHPDSAIIGATLLEMNQPDKIQALGGSAFDYYFARGHALYNGYKKDDIKKIKISYDDIGYVSGASMFITKENLKKIGLIPEDFVYYFEEIIWCMKAKKEGLNLGYAPECIVYHEGGATTKLLDLYKDAGNPYHFLYFRNKLIFARKYMPSRLPIVYIGIIIDWIKKYFIDKEHLDCKIFRHWEMWKIPTKDDKLSFADAMKILDKKQSK